MAQASKVCTTVTSKSEHSRQTLDNGSTMARLRLDNGPTTNKALHGGEPYLHITRTRMLVP